MGIQAYIFLWVSELQRRIIVLPMGRGLQEKERGTTDMRLAHRLENTPMRRVRESRTVKDL